MCKPTTHSRLILLPCLLGIAVVLITQFVNQAAAPPAPVRFSSPELLGLLRGDSNVGHVSFSPDGRMLAANNGPKVEATHVRGILLWEVATHRRRALLPPPRDPGDRGYQHSLFTPDGKRLIACTDKCAYVLDLDSPDKPAELSKGNFGVLAISADGRILAITFILDSRVEVWDIVAKKLLYSLHHPHGEKQSVYHSAFSPDGKTLAIGGSDRTASLWHVQTGKQLRILDRQKGDVFRVAFSPCGRILATGGLSPGDFNVRFWDTSDWTLLDTWPGHAEQGVQSLIFVGEGRFVLASSDMTIDPLFPQTGRVRFWDRLARKECYVLKESARVEMSVALCPDGKTLAVPRSNGEVALYRLTLPQHDAAPATKAYQPQLTHTKPLPKASENAWADLATEVAEKAYRAVRALAQQPDDALTLFATRLKRVQWDGRDKLPKLIAALGAEEYQERVRAERSLAELQELAEPALRRAAEGNDLEVRRRALRLLARLGPPVTDKERLRAIRSCEVLELISSQDARKLLRWLATGSPEATLTLEASSSLARLDRRAKAAQQK